MNAEESGLPTEPNPPKPAAAPAGDAETVTYLSEELLHGQREVFIRHGEETYRLRLTRQGKLILYK